MKDLFTEINYKNIAPVVAIVLGDGNTSIMDISLDSAGRSGIGFKRQKGKIGENSGHDGKSLSEVDPDFVIVSDNIGSLNVLLDKVKRAIKHLESTA